MTKNGTNSQYQSLWIFSMGQNSVDFDFLANHKKGCVSICDSHKVNNSEFG